MDELIRKLEREMIKTAFKSAGIPEEIWLLVDSLVEAGCRGKDVLMGLTNYSKRISEKRDKEELMELLKDLPIQFDEGE